MAWTRVKAAIGVLLMGMGFIGLPAIAEDLQRWPPIIAAVLGFVSDVAALFATFTGRWILFGVGAVIFWRASRASMMEGVAAQPAKVAYPVTYPAIPTGSPDVATPSASATTTHPAKLPTRRRQGRTYIDATVEQLTEELFEGRLHVAAKELAQAHIGKWMTVTGPLYEVYDFNESWQSRRDRDMTVVIGEGDFSHPDITLRFALSWKSRLAALKKGEQITVTGQIDALERGKLTLENCELDAIGGVATTGRRVQT